MYKSPIELIYRGMEYELEKGILKAVLKQDINVDKEELLRALQYDRGQYEKGYVDGKADAFEWIPIEEQKPKKTGRYLVAGPSSFGGMEASVAWYEVCEYVCPGKNVFTRYNIPMPKKITHWMPLPEPPKGD